jgi:hypothetical protein
MILMSFTARPLTVTEQALLNLSAVPDKLEVAVYEDIARCPSCTRLLGTVQGRCLHTGEIIIITHGTFRCRSCKTKLEWNPTF